MNRICAIERQLSYAGRRVQDDDNKFSLLNGLRQEYEVKKTILMESYDMTFEAIVALIEQT